MISLVGKEHKKNNVLYITNSTYDEMYSSTIKDKSGRNVLQQHNETTLNLETDKK